MKTWYNSLSPREQALVTYGGIVVLFILIWLLLVKPLYAKHIKLNKIIEKQKGDIRLMQKQSNHVEKLQIQNKKTAPKSSQNPQQLIERSLQTWRLKSSLERMNTQGSKAVRLTLKKANADRAMRFLYELENSHGLSINNMIINTSGDEAGFTDIRLTIKREAK
ncbi:MAG: type II secretion system protein M [Cocleimonas sp.]